jgi:hypothetical protein
LVFNYRYKLVQQEITRRGSLNEPLRDKPVHRGERQMTTSFFTHDAVALSVHRAIRCDRLCLEALKIRSGVSGVDCGAKTLKRGER